VEAVNAMLQRQQTDRDTSDDSGSEANDDEQGWTGFSESEDDKSAAPVDREDEYLDEDRYTTVTVESVDITKSGLQKAVPADAGEDSTSGDAGGEGGVVGRRLSTPSAKPKVRKKKFRYLSKGDRKAVRMKERSGNRARAKARRE
jgi:ribosomal RNA-processing protein 17